MIDHLEKMRARKAANDYMAGIPIRQQADELSVKKLAAKFSCTVYAINRALENMPAPGLTYEDGKLIRECYAEHQRLATQAQRLTMSALSKNYSIPVAAIQVELDLQGFVNPMRQADDRVVPA